MKILLIGPYGIGNTILTLPAIKILRKSLFPNARIDHLVLLSSVFEMVSNIPDFNLIDNIHYIDLKNKRTLLKNILKIRKLKYDFSILFFPSAKFHYNALSYLCKAKKRIGSYYPDINFRRGHYLNNIQVPVVINIHDVYQNINLLSNFGVDYKKIKIKKIISIKAKKKKKIIGIHTGCKKEAYFKRWAHEKYLCLIKKILHNTKSRIRMFFGPDEPDDYNFFKKNLMSPRIEFIIDKPFKEIFDLLNDCRIFISNDTGLMHVSNFLGAYNIVPGGPSDFRRTGPFNKPQKIITSGLKCIPCSHTYFVSSHKFKCIHNDIRCMKNEVVEDIWKELKKKL